MARNIADADFVLMICTTKYRLRVENKDEQVRGHGVVWEASIIYNHLYRAKMISEKFIPVLFADSSADDVPMPVAGFTRYDVSNEAGYHALFRRLTNQPSIEKPTLGKLRILPSKERTEESLPGAFSLGQLSKTMSNPKYADDLYRLDRTYQRNAVINRETIIIVVGTTVLAELLDRAADGYDTISLVFPRTVQPGSRLGRDGRGRHPTPMPDLCGGFYCGSRSPTQTRARAL
jgi:hypothetical protein